MVSDTLHYPPVGKMAWARAQRVTGGLARARTTSSRQRVLGAFDGASPVPQALSSPRRCHRLLRPRASALGACDDARRPITRWQAPNKNSPR